MDTNRFRKRTNYGLPPRKPLPADELDRPHQPKPSSHTLPPVQSSSQSATLNPKPLQSLSQSTAPQPAKKPAVEPLKPVYEATRPAREAVIDLFEPSHGGWLDAITPDSDEGTNMDSSAANSVTASSGSAIGEAGSEVAIAAPSPPQANISIQINMPNLPKLQWPKFKLPALPYRKIGLWSAISISSLMVVSGGILLTRHFTSTQHKLSVADGGASLSGVLKNPTFVPVVPKSKPQLAAGTSQATAFDGKRDSYSYTDVIQNVPFTVSEQPVPGNFSSANQAVTTIAQSLSATHTLKAAGTVAYEFKSAKTSTQTIVFSVDNLLVFVQSNFPHDDGTWETYIASLSQSSS